MNLVGVFSELRPLVRGLSGTEAGGARDPRSLAHHDMIDWLRPGVLGGVQAVRPPAGAAVPTPGYLPYQKT